MFTKPSQIAGVYVAVQSGHETVQAIAAQTKDPIMVVERALMWLLKYDFVRRLGEPVGHSLK